MSLPDPQDVPPFRSDDSKVEIPGRFKAIKIGEGVQAGARKWLVEDLIPESALALIFGESQAGKSFFLLNMLASIGAGAKFLGKQTSKGIAFYLASEGRDGLPARVNAWKLHHSADTVEVMTVDPCDFDPCSQKDVEGLIRVAKKRAGEAELPVKAIAFDTVSGFIAGKDENDAATFSRLAAVSGQIRTQLNAAVIWVHHPSKGQPKAPRGSNALYGAADTVIHVVVTGKSHSATVMKQRDGKVGDSLFFALKRVVEADSCVAVPASGGASEAPSGKPRTQIEADRLMELLGAMVRSVNEYERLSNGNDTAFGSVDYAEAKKVAFEQHYADAPTDDARRKQFERHLKCLADQGRISREGDLILVPDTTPATHNGAFAAERPDTHSIPC
jgi:hypothetical protein